MKLSDALIIAGIALFLYAANAEAEPRGEVDIGLPTRIGSRTWDEETGEETTPSKLHEGD